MKHSPKTEKNTGRYITAAIQVDSPYTCSLVTPEYGM